ncbi:MAG: hypothetical protein ABR528_07990 [Pseudonocardiaceae bacterium]
MTTFTASPEAPILDAAGGPGLSMQSVAQLVAGTLCGVHRVGGQFVRVNATVSDDGYIDVDVTQIDFTAENATVRVLLYPTAAQPVPPGSVPGPRNVA